MAIEIVTISVEELKGIINSERESAYATGYLKAKKEFEVIKQEPKFNEILWGVRELREYLEYKGWFRGSINTLNKVAYQLIAEGDKEGYRLKFRCTCIDHEFQNGFKFTKPPKKTKEPKTVAC